MNHIINMVKSYAVIKVLAIYESRAGGLKKKTETKRWALLLYESLGRKPG